jgi:hypothetical protein
LRGADLPFVCLIVFFAAPLHKWKLNFILNFLEKRGRRGMQKDKIKCGCEAETDKQKQEYGQ